MYFDTVIRLYIQKPFLSTHVYNLSVITIKTLNFHIIAERDDVRVSIVGLR